jgi:hypothetical protein
VSIIEDAIMLLVHRILIQPEYLMIAKALSQIAKILNHYDGSASLYSTA